MGPNADAINLCIDNSSNSDFSCSHMYCTHCNTGFTWGDSEWGDVKGFYKELETEISEMLVSQGRRHYRRGYLVDERG